MSTLSRRSFAESLAVAALAPLIGVRPETIRLGAWPPAPSHSASDPGAVAKALAEVIRRQYGSRLSAADLATVTRQIQTGLERVSELRKVELANGDEPDFVFSPVRHSSPAS
ncbi:MAG TPA: hypothetical protein VGP44_06290 [Gemmatimonadales bacterium]|nr:hypothetical protein [Gemmatimonadales bacterium]